MTTAFRKGRDEWQYATGDARKPVYKLDVAEAISI
jgi:hypothetical protein